MKKQRLFIELYKKAVKKHGYGITPTGKNDWLSCVNEFGLWYNDENDSTHLIPIQGSFLDPQHVIIPKV